MSNQLTHNLTENGSATENGSPLIDAVTNGTSNMTPPMPAMVSPEEMLQQMKELIVENYDLKEAMKQNNQAMKDRYEELSVWREKQRTEREFYELKFKEAQQCLLEVSNENEKLKKNVELLKDQNQGPIQGTHDTIFSRNEVSEESEQLKTQVTKLQAEKADLLAIISELQLKLNNASSEESFVEIRMAVEGPGELKAKEDLHIQTNEVATCMGQSMDEAKNFMESEKLTVSELLHSLKEETSKVKRLETELQITTDRLEELKQKVADVSEKDTQTDVTTEQEEKEDTKEDAFGSEVESLKQQVKTLCEELQEAHVKLDEAELMHKRLQEKCLQLDRRVSETEVDFEEKQQLQYAINKLDLQVESMNSERKIEQAKLQNQISHFTTLQKEYKDLQLDLDIALKTIEDLKIRESERVPKEVMNELNEKLELAENALAGKQLQIDKMKQTLVSQEEDIETISLLRAQLDVYCADFHAERSAREMIHQEKEHLAVQLEYMVKENTKLKEDLNDMGRQSIGELQLRHRDPGFQDHSPRIVQRGTEQQPHSIPMHACPKCGDILPDLDTLQIHVMDCII